MMDSVTEKLAACAGFGYIENGCVVYDKRLELFAELVRLDSKSLSIDTPFDEQDIVEKLINRANMRRMIGRSVGGKPDRIAVTCELAAEEIIRLRQEIDSLQLIGHARDTDIDKVLTCGDNIYDLSVETKSCWPEDEKPYPHLVSIYAKS